MLYKKKTRSRMNHETKRHTILLSALVVGVASFAYIISPAFAPVSYNAFNTFVPATASTTKEVVMPEPIPESGAAHVEKPEVVKAIYMTSWVGGTRDWRKTLIEFIEETELNAIVIDIKDDTGRISFPVEDPYLQEIGSAEHRIPDLREFLEWVHERDIYVIGRISVFQDPYLVKLRPDLAVKRESDGAVWTDHKGISWFDAGATEVWDYAVAIGKEAYTAGFDELNYDYIRFPSDGDMFDISYPFSDDRVNADPRFGKAEVLKEFYAYLHQNFKDTGAVISADLFGMVTTNKDDLNIGQIIEYAAPYFDHIAPMVYPSHYPANFIGLGNPNHYPYEVVKYSMDKAVLRLDALASTTNATSTREGHGNVGAHQLRPWLQDFDYGGNYDEEEVRAQMQAVYDAGLTSWMMWDPNNRYTRSAFDAE